MSQTAESSFRNNPKIIGQEAIGKVMGKLKSQPDIRVLLAGTTFADLINPEFQLFRSYMGFTVPIPEELIQQFDSPVSELDSFGPEGREDTNTICVDLTNTAGFLRGLVAAFYLAQADLDKLPQPKLNQKLIGPRPVPKAYLIDAVAEGDGAMMYDADDFRTKLRTENPELAEVLGILVGNAVVRCSERMVYAYAGVLSPALIERIRPIVTEAWDLSLDEFALNACAMLAPEPPALIPVPVRKPD